MNKQDYSVIAKLPNELRSEVYKGTWRSPTNERALAESLSLQYNPQAALKDYGLDIVYRNSRDN